MRKMEMKTRNYTAPTVKVVTFMVEHGFDGTLYGVNQPDTDTDGMMEKMNYQSEESQSEWDWTLR